eukprot:scaffold2366_cov159-Amphora_coffeaeformis.AAC.27
MKSAVSFVLLLLSAFASSTLASVFLPKTMEVKTGARTFHPSSAAAASSKNDFRRLAFRQRRASKSTAMAIPGYGIAEQYNLIITARILLSWFPQAQGIGLLQPVYAITDPYLNLFRELMREWSEIMHGTTRVDVSPLLEFEGDLAPGYFRTKHDRWIGKRSLNYDMH